MTRAMFRAGMILREILDRADFDKFSLASLFSMETLSIGTGHAPCKSFYENKEGTYYLKAGDDQPFAISHVLLVYL